MTADIVIRGGSLVDGTGAPARTADIAISDGVVSDIGTGSTGSGCSRPAGNVVAPGFIDIHTHYDAQVFWDPALTPSCWHGVTSVVAGNCGFSIAPVRPEHRELLVRTLQHVEDMAPDTLFEGVPWTDFETFPQYFDAIERRGTLLNYACYVGRIASNTAGILEVGPRHALEQRVGRHVLDVLQRADDTSRCSGRTARWRTRSCRRRPRSRRPRATG